MGFVLAFRRVATTHVRLCTRFVFLGGMLLILGTFVLVPPATAAQRVQSSATSGDSAPALDTGQDPLPGGDKELSLTEALSLFLKQNLAIVAAKFDLDTVRAEELTARLRPNPEFSVDAEDLPSNGKASFLNDQEIVAAVTFTLELAGKRGKRKELAAANTEVAEAEFETAMWVLTNDFKRDFYLVVLTLRRLELAEANQKTFDDILDDTRELYESGEISGLDLRRLEVEKISFDVDVANARIDYELALRNLRLRLGGDYRENDFTVSETLVYRDVPVSRADILQTALSKRPDLKAARAGSMAADADIRLQKAQRTPDLSLSGGYKRDFGADEYAFGFGFDLPIFDRNQGERAKALIEKKRNGNLQKILTNNVVADVDRALVQLNLQKQRVEAYRSGVMAGIDEIQALTEASYKAGESSILDLLDAIRTHRDTESAYSETLFDYQMSILDLELASATTIIQ